MVICYKHRIKHRVLCRRTNLSFEVITYGAVQPKDVIEIEDRLAARGFDAVVQESLWCDDTFDHSRGRGRVSGRGVQEKPQRHFFNRRIDVTESVQGSRDPRGFGTRNGEGRTRGVEEAASEEGRTVSGDQGE